MISPFSNGLAHNANKSVENCSKEEPFKKILESVGAPAAFLKEVASSKGKLTLDELKLHDTLNLFTINANSPAGSSCIEFYPVSPVTLCETNVIGDDISCNEVTVCKSETAGHTQNEGDPLISNSLQGSASKFDAEMIFFTTEDFNALSSSYSSKNQDNTFPAQNLYAAPLLELEENAAKVFDSKENCETIEPDHLSNLEKEAKNLNVEAESGIGSKQKEQKPGCSKVFRRVNSMLITEEKRTPAQVSEHELAELGRRRIWVIHQGVCSPVSWYEDTSAEDVKAALLCACDVLADGIDFCCTTGNSSPLNRESNNAFFLRQIGPIPDSMDVDSESLFMDVRVITLSGGCKDFQKSCAEFLCPSLRDSLNRKDEDFSKREESSASDGEFSFRVVQGRKLGINDFDLLMDGCLYLLECNMDNEEQETERTDTIRRVAGDRWRRLLVALDPLLHIETQKAIFKMTKGSNLLKHTRFGHPHLRQFQLSADRKRLIWYTSSKRKESSVLQLDNVYCIVLGQNSPMFESYRLPALQHLSFSLVYSREQTEFPSDYPDIVEGGNFFDGCKTLDLTCKDEFEFDTWVTGFKAIIAANKQLRISKQMLLSHSRRFIKSLAHNNVNIQLTKLPEIKDPSHVSLDDRMHLPWHFPEVLHQKVQDLWDRLELVASQAQLKDSRQCEDISLSDIWENGPAYASLFPDATIDDETMEAYRMTELLRSIADQLRLAKDELKCYTTLPPPPPHEEQTSGDVSSLESTVTPGSPAVSDCSVEETDGQSSSSESNQESDVLAISSGGVITTRQSYGKLSFSEEFKIRKQKSLSLSTVKTHVKDGLTNVLQQAAVHRAEAKKFIDTAVTAAVKYFGAEDDKADESQYTAEQVVKLKEVTQILWRTEVDVENVEDMFNRQQNYGTIGASDVADVVSDMNAHVRRKVNIWSYQIGAAVCGWINKVKTEALAAAASATYLEPRELEK